MAKKFSQTWALEPLEEDISFATKPMFGGLSVYYLGLMSLLLAENEGDREWKGQNFDFDIWNGILVCTSREYHQSLIQKWPQLVSHPILGKWLFLKIDDDDYERVYQEIVAAIAERDIRIGIIPGQRKAKKKKKKRKR